MSMSLNETVRKRRTPAWAAILAAVAATTLVAGCAPKPDRLSTGAVPDDYRARHPIVLAEGETTLDVPVSSGDTQISLATRDLIRGFASNYHNTASGVVQVMLPEGAPNSHAVQRIRRDIRAALTSGGVPANRIVEMRYQAQSNGDAAPVRLSYTAIKASAGPCGEWPEDLAMRTEQNQNYYNFGCATQSNLAAQVANPTDLLGPRVMSPVDAEQRNLVINNYRTRSALN
ncbi:pilus assembly protein CpaD [Rhizobium sp. RU20A]|uniref:CpaD family pilus assembly protein n=1 Tax=Rhizobium sp. RU20A TaxID=1907412 RepID=UPI000954FB05|nr:CpaD family pilus assembly protein [Rhizobium sp. RU20A]SIQ77492.1 pilus assembly protein CpaD [Rhizobium sp. RU20A]